MMPRDPNAPHISLHPRASIDSVVTATSAGNSIYMPRRVESIMGPEDAHLYHKTQAAQRPAGGAFYEAERNLPYGLNGNSSKLGFQDSVESLPDESVYNGKPTQRPHSRGNSDNSINSMSDSRAASQTRSPLSTEVGSDSLTVPRTSHHPGDRVSSASYNSAVRTGRSPLARSSFVRTAPGEDLAIELQQQQGLMESRDSSPAPPQLPSEPQHLRSESTESAKRKRKRLTKQPPGGSKS